jgi:predicted neuraminidase
MPLLLDDGRWLIPSSQPISKDEHHSYLLITDDGLRSWKKLGPILREDGQSKSTEPSLVQTQDKIVHIFMRNRQKEDATRRVLHAQFDPRTDELFVAKPTDVANPDSGVDALALPDGRLVMAANPQTKGRSPLSLLVSTDGGNRWKEVLLLEKGQGDFSQPALLLDSNKKLHVLYSFWSKETQEKNIKHLIIDTARL